MNKYINIEVAKEYLYHDSKSNPYFRSQACQQVIDILDTVPIADVVEVQHGRWIGVQLGDMQCSLCKEVYSVCAGLLGDYNYCPNCGAIMDGGNDE